MVLCDLSVGSFHLPAPLTGRGGRGEGEGGVEANDSFRPSCNFQNVVWKFDDSACSLALSLSLSLKRTVVGGRNLLSGANKFSWC